MNCLGAAFGRTKVCSLRERSCSTVEMLFLLRTLRARVRLLSRSAKSSLRNCFLCNNKTYYFQRCLPSDAIAPYDHSLNLRDTFRPVQ